MNYEVVKYTPEFKNHVAKLRRHLQSPDVALNAEYLDWKYGRNPYVDSRLIYVALHRGQVVGMRGIWGAKWQIGHPCQTLVAPCAGDLAIDPAHRNHGVFTKIMRAVLKDLAAGEYTYVFNLSAGPATAIRRRHDPSPFAQIHFPAAFSLLGGKARPFFLPRQKRRAASWGSWDERGY
jgi:GNAT superfamily N-acetyltransferase